MHALPLLVFLWMLWMWPKPMMTITAILIVVTIVFVSQELKKQEASKPDYPAAFYAKRGMEPELDTCFWDRTKSKHPNPDNPACKSYFDKLANGEVKPDYKVLQPPVVEKKPQSPVRRVY